MIYLANHYTSNNHDTYSFEIWQIDFNNFHKVSNKQVGYNFFEVNKCLKNNKKMCLEQINKKMDVYHFLNNRFKTKTCIGWRSDLSFFNLRKVFLNLIRACHVLWTALKNNGRIVFVSHPGLDNQAYLSFIDSLVQKQNVRTNLPRTKSQIKQPKQKSFSSASKTNKTNYKHINFGHANPLLKFTQYDELRNLLNLKTKETFKKSKTYDSYDFKNKINDFKLGLNSCMLQGKTQLLNSRNRVISYGETSPIAKGWFSNSDATVKQTLNNFVYCESHKTISKLTTVNQRKDSFINHYSTDYNTIKCYNSAESKYNFDFKLYITFKTHLKHYVYNVNLNHFFKIKPYAKHYKRLLQQTKVKHATTENATNINSLTKTLGFNNRFKNSGLNKRIKTSYINKFYGHVDYFNFDLSQKSSKKKYKYNINSIKLKSLKPSRTNKSLIKFKSNFIKFIRNKQVFETQFCGWPTAGLFQTAGSKKIRNICFKTWLRNYTKMKFNSKLRFVKPPTFRINGYDNYLFLNAMTKYQQFAKNPLISLSQASVLIFSHPEKAFNLVNQARVLQKPSIGLVSGFSSPRHMVSNTTNLVDFPILGNSENINFVSLVFNHFIKLSIHVQRK